jgi:hypothetical protein
MQLEAAQQEAAGHVAAAAAAEDANAGLSKQLAEAREQLRASAQQVRCACLLKLLVGSTVCS